MRRIERMRTTSWTTWVFVTSSRTAYMSVVMSCMKTVREMQSMIDSMNNANLSGLASVGVMQQLSLVISQVMLREFSTSYERPDEHLTHAVFFTKQSHRASSILWSLANQGIQ